MAAEVSTPAALSGPAGLDPLARSRLSRLLIAVVRVVVALLWIQNSSWKKPPDFIAITLSVLNTPGEWPWSYFLMLTVHVALFATAAGRFYGLDGVLRARWLRQPGRLSRWLARLS